METTGYFKLIDSEDQIIIITLIARHSGSYSGDDGCEALRYHGMLSADGDAYFRKKLYHGDGGYNTDKFGAEGSAIDDVKDEWIGVKSVTYNVEDNGVKLELWVGDRDEENNWEKVAEYIYRRGRPSNQWRWRLRQK
jgi:hypothetical protein